MMGVASGPLASVARPAGLTCINADNSLDVLIKAIKAQERRAAMEEKPSLRANFTKSVRSKAKKVGVLFAEALGESEKAAKERGHLATRTDHAFVGCNPCPPGDMVPPAETVTNLAAIPRPRKRDK